MPRRNVVLKCVDDLVPDDVIGFSEAGGKRQHDPPLARFREAAGVLVDEAAPDVGLLEAAMAAVEDERLAPGETVFERFGQPRVPPLGQTPGNERGVAVLARVVHVEVLGREHLHVIAIVLNFVAAEILRVRVGGDATHEGSRDDEPGEPGQSHRVAQYGGGDISHRWSPSKRRKP
jgi:hypothetical protein